MTQNEMIIEHLKTHPNGITPREAEDRFGCMKTEFETRKNRYGRRVTYARYKLVVDGDKTGNP